MFRAAQPDAFRAHLPRHARILRRVRIRAHAERPHFVRPFHQRGKSLRRLRAHQRNLAGVHHAFASIERQPFALAHRAPIRRQGLLRQINLKLLRPHDATLPPPARDHRRVARLPAGRRQDSLRHVHSPNVLRARLVPHQNHLLPARRPGFRVLRREHRLAHRRSRHRVDSAHHLPCGQVATRQRRIDHRIEQPLHILRLDSFKSFFNFDQPLVHHVHGHAERGRWRALPRARLQHVQLPVLDREFQVLHVAVMFLERLPHALELLVNFRHELREFVQMHGRANSRHHVLALRVQQEIAKKCLFSGRRVAREAHSRPGIVAGVPINHLHHVHRRAQQPGDLLHPPIGHRFLAHPRFKHRANRAPQLFFGVLRKSLSRILLKVFLVLAHQLAPTLGRNLRIVFHSQAILHRPQARFEVFLGQPDHHARIHLHESPVRIIGKAPVLRRPRQALHRLIVQSQIQDRFHHPGHRPRRARAHAHQQRILRIPQFLAGQFLQALQIFLHFLLQLLRIFAPVLEIVIAGLRRDREPGRDRQADAGHLRQARAFAAEQVLHVALAVRFPCAKKVNVFHFDPRLFRNLNKGMNGLASKSGAGICRSADN